MHYIAYIMELSDFIRLMFDKDTDRYPEIRASFLSYWSPKEVLDILAVTNYKCSTKELRKYIKYSCSDKGVSINSLVHPSWSYDKNVLVNTTITTNVEASIRANLFLWTHAVLTVKHGSSSIMKLESQNSEFQITCILCGTTAHSLDGNAGDIQGTIESETNIFSKFHDRNMGFHSTIDIHTNLSLESKTKLDKIIDSTTNIFCTSIVRLRKIVSQHFNYGIEPEQRIEF